MLVQYGAQVSARPDRGTWVYKLDDCNRYLRGRIGQAKPRWIPATVLLREIRKCGYTGSINQLKAWLAPLKKNEPEPLVRFETSKGQQMQADFTYVRRGRDTAQIWVLLVDVLKC